ncbi:glycine zipper domain-containing protein [Pseudochrobactrum sp. MP213Fo]|uniref:glycine zipper domain-containing protein n=1 Tax=Pseudochrobactrum sp. MP213Fo TaxID=3022250 RepID=UPI003BA2B830
MASKMRNDAEKSFEDQIAELKSELASVTKKLSQQGNALYDDARENASETYDVLRKRGRVAAREVKHQAQVVTDTARENPLAAAAVVAGIGLVLALLARR